MTPVDYSSLKKDNQFKYYLRVLIFYNEFQLAQGLKIEQELNKVIHGIEAELENRN
jgi:hypothetical protein